MAEEITVTGSKGGTGKMKTDIFSLIRTHIHIPNALAGPIEVSWDSFPNSILSRVHLHGEK